MLLLLYMIAGVLAMEQFEQYKSVRTKFGSVRGKRLDSYGGHSGFVFAGIPLAKPPVGNLRFKTLRDPDPWSEELEAFNYRNACLADPVRTYKKDNGGSVSEDCMYINVFTTKKCLDQGGCAVMGVIHGGGLVFESPAAFRMDVIVNNFANEERNVVVVTIPYRLGTAGFFQLKEGVKTIADTNLGIRDMIRGFQWIQDEIHSFGGNPRKVTAMGHSAGAAAVYWLALLPSTAGLFSQIIVMSGPSIGGDLSKKGNTMNSRAISRLVGCASDSETFESLKMIRKVTECVQSVSAAKLLAAQLETKNMVEEIGGPWIDGPGGLIPFYFKHLKQNPKKLNVLTGTTTAEYRYTTSGLDSRGRPNVTRVHEICEAVGYLRNYQNPEKFTKECVKFYSNGTRIESFADDYLFYYPTAETANAYSNTGGNVFVYSYDYWGANDAFEKFIDAEYAGPSHSEDYIYIFGVHRNEDAMKPKDFEIERIYSGMVANFVNSGDPSYLDYKWEKWDEKRRNHFLIDFDKNVRMPGIRDGYYNDEGLFWEELAQKSGGEWTPLEDFPPKIDLVYSTHMINAYAAGWQNKSTLMDKTFSVSMETYKLWSNHVKYLKEKIKSEDGRVYPWSLNRNLPMSRNELSEVKAAENTINWLTISLVVTVVILSGYILVTKIMECKKRKGYNKIPN